MNNQIQPKVVSQTPTQKSVQTTPMDNSKFEQELELAKIALQNLNQISGLAYLLNDFKHSQDFPGLQIENTPPHVSGIKKTGFAEVNNNFSYSPAKIENSQPPEQLKPARQTLQDIITSQSGSLIPLLIPFQTLLYEINQRITNQKVNLAGLAEEIIGKIKFLKEGKKTELELNLLPKEFGKLTLNISSQNGIISIAITATPMTKEILESNLAELKTALQNANLNIGNLAVDIGQSGQQNQPEATKTLNFVETQENLFTPFTDSYILSRKLGWLPKLIIREVA